MMTHFKTGVRPTKMSSMSLPIHTRSYQPPGVSPPRGFPFIRYFAADSPAYAHIPSFARTHRPLWATYLVHYILYLVIHRRHQTPDDGRHDTAVPRPLQVFDD